MSIELIIAIVWLHWVADFVLQSHWMASNKSKRNDALAIHIAIYSACLLIGGWQWAIVNGLAHWATDYVTCRITSRLWAAGRIHDFFVVIGLDQAIHLSCLYGTSGLFRPLLW